MEEGGVIERGDRRKGAIGRGGDEEIRIVIRIGVNRGKGLIIIRGGGEEEGRGEGGKEEIEVE